MDRPTVSVVKDSVDEKILRAQYGDNIKYNYGENQFVGYDRAATNQAYQRYLTNAGVNPINFNVDLDSFTGVPVYNGKLVGGYDEASAIGNIENSLRDSASDYFASQSAGLGQVLNNTITTLGKAYEDAIAEGSMSVRQAQTDFAERKKQLEQQAYAQAEATRVNSNAMGIGNSQQRAGLMAGDNARANANVQSAMSERDKRVADVLDRMSAISQKMGLDLSAAQKDYDLGMLQASSDASKMVTDGMLNVRADSLNANRAQDFYEKNAATQFGYDVDKMDIQQQYVLEQMAEAFGYDLSKMSTQQKYTLAQMAQAFGYDLDKMARAHGYDMEKTTTDAYYSGKITYDNKPSNIPDNFWNQATEIASQHGVDPLLLAAIAQHETNYGKLGAGRDGYALGVGVYDSGNPNSNYKDEPGSYQKQLAWAAQSIAKHLKGDVTAESIKQYQNSSGYATDPNWANAVWRVYSQLKSQAGNIRVIDNDKEAEIKAMKAYGINPNDHDALEQLREKQNAEKINASILSAYKTGEAEAILNNPALNSTQTTAPVYKSLGVPDAWRSISPVWDIVDWFRNWGYDDKLAEYNAYQEALKKKIEFLESMGIVLSE